MDLPFRLCFALQTHALPQLPDPVLPVSLHVLELLFLLRPDLKGAQALLRIPTLLLREKTPLLDLVGTPNQRAPAPILLGTGPAYAEEVAMEAASAEAPAAVAEGEGAEGKGGVAEAKKHIDDA